MNEQILQQARFDPKVQIYWYFHGVMVHAGLIFGIIGLFTLPLWMVLGIFVVRARYEALSAVLTDRAIHLKSGVIYKVEKTIPLEKIQDLSLRSGPLLSAFGLASVTIETAGGSAQAGADMSLPGLANAEEFRNAVLAQRDARSGASTVAPVAASSDALLSDIRDSLQRIEALLAARDTAGRG